MRIGACVAIATLSLVVVAADARAAPPNFGKCTSIQARCAMAISGRCNPRTGYWQYGYTTGGTAEAYDACISRAVVSAKRK
jgi:hypothetical protein